MTYLDIYKKLKKSTVGIAGCGGLGSNCAVALARVHVGKLVIVDFDKVELSNLNRQYYFYNQIGQKKVHALKNNLIAINPETNVESHDLKLDNDNIQEIFKNCDIIVEAFDKKEMKQMIIENVMLNSPDKPLIVGNGMAGFGDSNSLKLSVFNNIYVCGDNVSEISETSPPLAPRVGIVANMQANTVLELLLNKKLMI